MKHELVKWLNIDLAFVWLWNSFSVIVWLVYLCHIYVCLFC